MLSEQATLFQSWAPLYARIPICCATSFATTHPCYIALDPDAANKERRIIQTLLRYDVELHKIDVRGYDDVGEMPQEVFMERKANAMLIDRDNYVLLDLLSAV